MATLPAPDTFAAGEKVTALKLNANVRDNVNFLLNPPTSQVFQTAQQNFATSGSFIVITWDTELYDTDNMVNLGTQNDRITIVTPGLYSVTLAFSFATNGTGIRIARVLKNGATEVARETSAGLAGTSASMVVSIDLRLAAGDYLVAQGQQTSGGALSSSTTPCFMSARWVGK